MIPVCEPFLDGKEREYVLDALDTSWISSAGKYIGAFEEAMASYCGVKHAIATSNGTTAHHLAVVALEIGPGDEVIVPDFNGIFTAFAVCYTGAKPVFVDAEPDTWNMNPALVEEKITPRTKAIVAVHIYGHPCDMDPIRKIAARHGLPIIEDAAEVHGAEYTSQEHGTTRKAGALGDISIFSFFANKIVTTGEGGMVLTDDDSLAEKVRYHKNLCFPLNKPREYVHHHIGFNYRMSNLHAAIGLAQVEKIEQYVAARRHNNRVYRDYLEQVPGLRFQAEREWAKNVYWMNGIVIDEATFGASRAELEAALTKHSIGYRPFFHPMHLQPALEKYGCDCSGNYPVSSELGRHGLYLPSGSALTEQQIEEVCDVVKRAAG